MLNKLERKLFKVVTNWLLERGIPFKFKKDYLDCDMFTLHIDYYRNKVWIETATNDSVTPTWIQFTAAEDIKKYLKTRIK